MPGDTDPADVREVRKGIFNSLDDFMEEEELTSSRNRKESGIFDFDEETGFWKSSVRNKPPRWIFHLVESDGGWEAKVPNHSASDRMGYYNTADRDNVSVISTRIVAAINTGTEWTICEEWEWIVIITLAEPLPSSTSGPTVSGFSPPEFNLTFMGENLSPLALQIYTLCDPDSTCSAVSDDLTYGDATDSLRELFGVDVDEEESSSNGE